MNGQQNLGRPLGYLLYSTFIGTILKANAGGIICQTCVESWVVRLFPHQTHKRKNDHCLSQVTLESFSNLAFIFTNPRNFRVAQLSMTIWFSSFCLDAFWYKRVSCSRRGSINGCGAPSVEAIFTSNGDRKAATWGWEAVLTDSAVPSGNMTAPSSRRWHRTSELLSHSPDKPSSCSWGLLDPTSSELMVSPAMGNRHCKGQKSYRNLLFFQSFGCSASSPNQMKHESPFSIYDSHMPHAMHCRRGARTFIIAMQTVENPTAAGGSESKYHI